MLVLDSADNVDNVDIALDAARALANKLNEIADNDSYRGLLGMALAHGFNYTGPTWEHELKKLEEALSYVR